MIRFIHKFLLTVGVFSAVALPLAAPSAVYAATTSATAKQAICDGLDAKGCTGGAPDINGILKLVLNIFSAIVGFIAVIMIIIGGLKYVTSMGDSNSINSAKNTLLYAVIGLVVVTLAQVAVKFVLTKAAHPTGLPACTAKQVADGDTSKCEVPKP